MPLNLGSSPALLASSLKKEGYVRLTADDWAGPDPAPDSEELSNLASSWERLEPDTWMGDGGHYRLRRFAAFRIHQNTITREPHQPHFQAREYNTLNGGVERWFAPVEEAIGNHPIVRALLLKGAELAEALACDPNGSGHKGPWHAEMHQFRIDASNGDGKPTPEGTHRDGVCAVLMTIIGRHNILGGTTLLMDGEQRVAEFLLSTPLDTIIVDDRRMRHYVSPVSAIDTGEPAWRDALVLTFRAE